MGVDIVQMKASVSPVLENVIYRPTRRRSSDKIVPILGVPCDAVSAFIEFIYSSRLVVLIP